MDRAVGVEEEMFLIDPSTRRLVAASDRAAASPRAGGEIEQELFLQQVETQSAPHHALAEVLDDLRTARRRASDAAHSIGARLAAMPTPVLADEDGEVTPKARYERMIDRYGPIGRDALVCGTHIHVDIADDDEGVAVIDGLRPWLPLVLALSTNSPFDLGVDTSFASWRAEVWESWPAAGAVEPFHDAVGYRQAVAAIIASGAALDEGMIYFDARLARSFPTVEIRVADICTDLSDTMLIAAIVRALVDTCATTRPGPGAAVWRVDLLRAARWRARRDGISGSLLDPVTALLTPADRALHTLLTFIGPALDRTGDRSLVEDGIARLLRDGTGSSHQRAVAGPDLDLVAVVDDVLERTLDPGHT